MRGFTAIVLLLLMLAAFLTPAALATATNPMPACCRAGGRHHCSGMALGGVRAQGQSCPYRKPLTFSGSATPSPATWAVAPADPHPFLHEFYPELFVSPGKLPHPERAPPPTSSMK